MHPNQVEVTLQNVGVETGAENLGILMKNSGVKVVETNHGKETADTGVQAQTGPDQEAGTGTVEETGALEKTGVEVLGILMKTFD